MNADRKARIAIRLTFLVVAAVALAIVCRQGSSLFAAGLIFVVYVAAGTLWVRGQYQASVEAAREGDDNLLPWTFPYWISLPSAVIGAVLFIVGVKGDTSSLLLAGAILAYLSLGYVLMRFRNKGSTKWRLGVGGATLVVSALLLVFGLLTLESHDRALWAVVLGFLTAPVGLSVLAAPTVRWLQYASRGFWVAGIAGLGALLLVADAAVAIARVDTRWMLLVFVAIALLVLAIVSSTQADIAVVIAAVTLMGVTSMSEENQKHWIRNQGRNVSSSLSGTPTCPAKAPASTTPRGLSTRTAPQGPSTRTTTATGRPPRGPP
jgi:hypothetical protein